MADLSKLNETVREQLTKNGFIEKIKNEVKSEIIAVLSTQTKEDEHKPKLSNENLLINDLIREYLDFNNYQFTSNVLVAETGQPKIIMNREFLCDQLNVSESPSSNAVPLLYSLIHQFKEQSPNRQTVINAPPQFHNHMSNPNQVNRNGVDPTRLKVPNQYESDDTSSVRSFSQHSNVGPVYSARDYLQERSDLCDE